MYKKFSPAPTNGEGLRPVCRQAGLIISRTGVLSGLGLRTDLRNGEREPAATVPPAARLAVARAQPATTIVTVRVEQGRSATGILDGFVHGNDPPKTHRLDLLVRKHFTDKAGDFGVRGFELALGRECTNLLGDPIVIILEEHALEDGDFGRHARGRLEVLGPEHALGVISDAEAFLLEARDPFLAGRSIALDREVDDTVLLAPGTLEFGNRGFATEELQRSIMATEFLDDGVQLSGGKTGRCEFCACAHGYLLALTWAVSFPLRRGGTMTRHKSVSKNYPHSIHSK